MRKTQRLWRGWIPCAAAAGAALTVGCSPPVARSPEPGGTSSLAATPAPSAACALPAERPTYLPPGFQSEPSVQSTVPGLGAEAGGQPQARRQLLVWEGASGEYVLLSAADDSPYLHEPPWARVQVRGHAGVFVWIGDPYVGPVNLIWRERSGRCGIYELSSRLRQLPGGPAPDLATAARGFQQEAARIAESLR